MLLANQARNLSTAVLFSDTRNAFYAAVHTLFAGLNVDEAESDEVLARVCARLQLPADTLRQMATAPGGPLTACGVRQHAAVRVSEATRDT
eukprot:9221715-Lingulodinium_polyedra.AAC.1